MNWTLFAVVFTIALTVVIGVLMIAALVMGFREIAQIRIVIAVGLALCLPISWYYTKKLSRLTGNEGNEGGHKA